MKKILPQLLLFVVLIGVYIMSERMMRRVVYPVPAEDKLEEERKRLLSALPGPVQTWAEQKLKVSALQEQIDAEENLEKRADLYYKMAGMVGDSEQRTCYRTITEIVPTSPTASRAWISLLGTSGTQEDVNTYLAYIERCEFAKPNQKVNVWSAGWGIAQSGANDVKLSYLEKMAAAEIVSSGLVDAYGEMGNIANLKGRLDLTSTARKMHEACLDLYRAEQERQQK